jgi:hypothetical protein
MTEFSGSDRAQGGGENSGSGLKQQMTDAARHLKQEARSGVDEAKQAAERIVETRRKAAIGEVGRISSAIGAAADQLEQDEASKPVAQLFREASWSVKRLASKVDGKSPGDLYQNLEEFARRQPAAVIAGATVLGILAGRFLRASSPPRRYLPAPADRHSNTSAPPSSGSAAAADLPDSTSGY